MVTKKTQLIDCSVYDDKNILGAPKVTTIHLERSKGCIFADECMIQLTLPVEI